MSSAALVAFICTLAAPSLADQPMPPAIGRVAPVDANGTRTGDAICTGVLVAADLVLTAGHCLPEKSPGAPFAFDAGLGPSGAVYRGLGTRYERLEKRPLGPLGLDNDLALLRLDAPVPDHLVAPLPRGGALSSSATLFAYDRAQPDAKPLAQSCRSLARWPEDTPRVVAFDCRVVSGNSGAPLLIETRDGWQVGAIMVARGSAPFHSLAVIPPSDDRW